MDTHATEQLEEFLQDIPFPIDRDGLVHEAFDSPLPNSIREAIALLPEHEYRSRDELKMELIGREGEEHTLEKETPSEEHEDDVSPTESDEPPQNIEEPAVEEPADQ